MPRIELIICKKCSYDLIGLGTRGKCPECGSYFDIERSVGVRLPERETATPDFYLARARTVALAVLAVAIVCLGTFASAVTASPQGISIGFFIGAVLLMGAFTSYMYERRGEYSPSDDEK